MVLIYNKMIEMTISIYCSRLRTQHIDKIEKRKNSTFKYYFQEYKHQKMCKVVSKTHMRFGFDFMV